MSSPKQQHEASEAEIPAGLRVFVTAAREQPVAPSGVTAEAVAAGLEHELRRRQARRTLMLSGATALAASIVAVGLLWPVLSARERGEHEPSRDRAVLEQTSESENSLAQGPGNGSERGEEPSLASAVRLRSTAPVEVRGAWSIALGEGTHELEVDPAPGHALAIELPERRLELVEGSMIVEVVDGGAAVRLHTGVAAWIDEDGQRTSISIERLELEPPPAPEGEGEGQAAREPVTPTAAELAREAESLLAAGRRDAAIEIYRELVRAHPRASQTRAGLLDLARLLRAARRENEARCAYRLYLERWPRSSVRNEVESQLERLGEGPSCGGLRPRTR